MDTTVDKLKVFGLDVRAVDMPEDMPESGVKQDVARNETVFAVRDEAYAFSGCSKAEYTLALLAREYVLTRTPRDPVRAFLSGMGGAPVKCVSSGRSDYFVFAVYCAAANSVVNYLRTMADVHDLVQDMGEGITAFCKEFSEELDYRSAGEFAVVLKENLSEEIKETIKIGVGGTAHGASELPMYYSFAKSAVVSGSEFDPHSDIYSYKDYALTKALSSLPSVEKEWYIKTVLDKSYRDVLTDSELMAAADALFMHSLNISEASRSMYVHRNTLIYRLDKIEKITGLNIRNFNDALTFRVACMLYKML